MLSLPYTDHRLLSQASRQNKCEIHEINTQVTNVRFTGLTLVSTEGTAFARVHCNKHKTMKSDFVINSNANIQVFHKLTKFAIMRLKFKKKITIAISIVLTENN